MAAVLVLLIGLVLIGGGRGIRRRHGLAEGRTVGLDSVTLTSPRYGLTGRPDRLVRTEGTIIPEEWKHGRKIYDSHRAQIGVYFLLIEDQLGMRPPYGVVVLGDGTRHRIANTEGLRAWVLELADEIRAARAAVSVPMSGNPTPGQCRACGMRRHCGQARGAAWLKGRCGRQRRLPMPQ